MTDSEIDLNGVTKVSRSQIVSHPAYMNKVLMTQHGWQQNGKVVWNKDIEFSELKEHGIV